MRALWNSVADAFAARTQRERLAIMLVAVLGLPLAIAFAWAEPRWKQAQGLEDEVERTRAMLSSPIARIDPNPVAREELVALSERLQRMQGSLRGLAEDLISPQEMTAMLETLVRTSPGVRLVALRALGSEPLAAPAIDATQAVPRLDLGALPSVSRASAGGPAATTATPTPRADAAVLYRHGIEVELQGDWSALRAYLGQVERSPKRLLWERLELDASRHPVLALKLRLATVGMEAAWLRL